jgi:hypothetical protein
MENRDSTVLQNIVKLSGNTATQHYSENLRSKAIYIFVLTIRYHISFYLLLRLFCTHKVTFIFQHLKSMRTYLETGAVEDNMSYTLVNLSEVLWYYIIHTTTSRYEALEMNKMKMTIYNIYIYIYIVQANFLNVQWRYPKGSATEAEFIYLQNFRLNLFIPCLQ